MCPTGEWFDGWMHEWVSGLVGAWVHGYFGGCDGLRKVGVVGLTVTAN